MSDFIKTIDTVGNTLNGAFDAALDATANVASRIGNRLKNVSPMRTVAVGAVALAAFVALPNAASAASINDEDSITTQTDEFFTASEESEAAVISPEQKAVDAAVASVSKKLQDAGASKESADVVSNREAKIFFGADRAEITKVEADGVCIVTTHEGKTLKEFTKTTLSPQNTAAEAQLIMIDALCDNEGGVNVPAVATVMAKIEAMKNDIDINAEFSKVYGEISQKYIEAMQGNPQVADAFLKDAQKFLKDAEFGQPYDISGRTDLSVYVGNDGIINSLVVTNKAGATAVPVVWVLNSGGNAEPKKQPQDEKACAQPTVVEEAPTPVVETPEVTTQVVVTPTVPTPTTAPTPSTTPSTSPTTVPEDEPEIVPATVRTCVGLNEDGTPKIESFTRTGPNYLVALANATLAAQQNYEREGECDTPVTIPTTTTPTTAPTTAPTTGPTTAPTTAPTTGPTTTEKDPTQTTFPVPETTVPPTDPDTTNTSRPDAVVTPGADADQGEGGGPILASASPQTVPVKIREAITSITSSTSGTLMLGAVATSLTLVGLGKRKSKKLGQAS